MTGIFLLLLLGLWLWACIAMTSALVRRMHATPWRFLVGPVVFAALLFVPVADEIVGGRQFEALCREGAVLKIDAERIKGRKIRLTFEPSNAAVTGKAVPVTYTRVVFRAAESDEELGSYQRYVAKGGWLIHALGASDSNSPIWMSRDYCSPDLGSREIAAKYGFEIIN